MVAGDALHGECLCATMIVVRVRGVAGMNDSTKRKIKDCLVVLAIFSVIQIVDTTAGKMNLVLDLMICILALHLWNAK